MNRRPSSEQRQFDHKVISQCNELLLSSRETIASEIVELTEKLAIERRALEKINRAIDALG